MNQKIKGVNVDVPKAVQVRLNEHCSRRGQSAQSVMNELIQNRLYKDITKSRR